MLRQYGYSVRGIPPVVSDYSYSRWAAHYSVILAISSEGLLACCVLKNPHERLCQISQFLDEQLLYQSVILLCNWENPRSVLVMGEQPQRTFDLHFSFVITNREQNLAVSPCMQFTCL